MTERRLTFIDVDENRLGLWLKRDRIQLEVVDSRPELEAGELRRFASVVFAEYVGRDLAARLGAARIRLREIRDRARGDDLAAVLDSALRAIDDVTAVLAVSDPDPAPDLEPPVAVEPVPSATPAMPAPPGGQPYRVLASLTTSRLPRLPRPLRPLQPLRPRRGTKRGPRAREGGTLGWGWRRVTGDPAVAPR